MTTPIADSRKLHNRAVLGVLLMLGGLALYALSDAFIKQLMGSYSVPQTSFMRAFTRLVPLSIAIRVAVCDRLCLRVLIAAALCDSGGTRLRLCVCFA